MVEWQFIQYIDMVQIHWQNSQIIGGLLSTDQLIEWDFQAEAIDLSFDLDLPGADDAQIQLFVVSSHTAKAV